MLFAVENDSVSAAFTRGAVEQGRQAPFAFSTSMLWQIRSSPLSCVYPRPHCQDGVSLDVPNTHLLWGYTSVWHNKVRSSYHGDFIFTFIDWLSLGSLVALRQRESAWERSLVSHPGIYNTYGDTGTGMGGDAKGGTMPRVDRTFTSLPLSLRW